MIQTVEACPRTPPIAFALEEVGADYTVARRPKGYFLRTFGIVGPRLVHGDVALLEPDAAIRYVASRAGRWPREPERAAEADAWMEMQTAWLRPAAARFGVAHRAGRAPHPSADPDHAVATAVLGRMERRLGTHDFALDVFTPADCSACALLALPGLGFDLGVYPGVNHYLDRLVRREAFRRAQQRLTASP